MGTMSVELGKALADSTAQLGQGVTRVATEVKETVAVTAFHLERVADHTTKTIGDVTVKCVGIIAFALCFMVSVVFAGGPQPAYQLFANVALQARCGAAALTSYLFSAVQAAAIVSAVGGTSYLALPPVVQKKRASREALKLHENMDRLQMLLRVKQELITTRATDCLKTEQRTFASARGMMVEGHQCSAVITDCQAIFMTPSSITLEQEIEKLLEMCEQQKGTMLKFPSLDLPQWALLTQLDGLVREAQSPMIEKEDSDEIQVLAKAAIEEAGKVQAVVETLQQTNRRLEDRLEQVGQVCKRLEERLAQLEEARASQETATSALQDRITPLETARSALEGRLTPLETARSGIEARLTPLERAPTALEGRLTPLETARTAIEGRLTPLETARTAIEDRLAPLETSRKAVEAWMGLRQRQFTGFEVTLRCHSKHILVPYKIPNSTFTCAFCTCKLETGSEVLACRSCDFDACERCCIHKDGRGARFWLRGRDAALFHPWWAGGQARPLVGIL